MAVCLKVTPIFTRLRVKFGATLRRCYRTAPTIDYEQAQGRPSSEELLPDCAGPSCIHLGGYECQRSPTPVVKSERTEAEKPHLRNEADYWSRMTFRLYV